MHEGLWKEQHECIMRVRDSHVRRRVSLGLCLCLIFVLKQIVDRGIGVASKCWEVKVEE
jgi:hypothetical protein